MRFETKKRGRFLFFEVGLSAVIARAAVLSFKITVVRAFFKAAFFSIKRLFFAAESAFFMRAPAEFFAGLKSALSLRLLGITGISAVRGAPIKVSPFKTEASFLAAKSAAKTGYALLARAAYFHAHWPAT